MGLVRLVLNGGGQSHDRPDDDQPYERTMEAKMTARNGSAEWRGDIRNGSGTVTVGNGVFEGAYSYGSRFGEEAGTNPEQLIAAAQAACYTMALTAILSAAGHVPESVRTNALVHLRNVDGAPM